MKNKSVNIFRWGELEACNWMQLSPMCRVGGQTFFVLLFGTPEAKQVYPDYDRIGILNVCMHVGYTLQLDAAVATVVGEKQDGGHIVGLSS